MGNAKPSVLLGLSSHTIQPQGTPHQVPRHCSPSCRLQGRGGRSSPLLTTTLLVDSQRHRITDEEVQQNRFQMPLLEEGEEVQQNQFQMLPPEEGESGWRGAWRQ